MRFSYRSVKAWLSFRLGQNPVIESPRVNFRKYIPIPYEGVVIISADFELAWAWRFDKRQSDPLTYSLDQARRERNNIPRLLELSNQFNIPVTWGTVGHLLLEKCDSIHGKKHMDINRIPYFENQWWKYKQGDWFDMDPCLSFSTSPEWYAPDLIKRILDDKIGHEIGCHSFSHINCSDTLCPPEVIESELAASQKAADKYGIRLESFIFPGHTMGNYDSLRSMGYTSMRTNFINVLGYPFLHPSGLWEHKTTMELFYNPLFSIAHNLNRYQIILNKCMKNHQVCNLWFHPSMPETDLRRIVPTVYGWLDSNRDRIWTTTMKEYTSWLNTNTRR
jgi:hypothetical protein